VSAKPATAKPTTTAAKKPAAAKPKLATAASPPRDVVPSTTKPRTNPRTTRARPTPRPPNQEPEPRRPDRGLDRRGTLVGASAISIHSVHLLVAHVVGHHLEPLADESVFLGLGSAVVERGFLGGEARAELAATLARFAAVARSLGADTIAFLGTEPIRRAADAARVVADAHAIEAHRSTSCRTRMRPS
jgi:hypothetical protein